MMTALSAFVQANHMNSDLTILSHVAWPQILGPYMKVKRPDKAKHQL